MPSAEQVAGEEYLHGKRIRVVITDVKKGLKGPSITVSRHHPDLVKRLAYEESSCADAGYLLRLTNEIVAGVVAADRGKVPVQLGFGFGSVHGLQGPRLHLPSGR